jgi:putative nucleotidyltransferase with HDIG domain
MRTTVAGCLERVNKELWIVLSLFVVAFALNHLLVSQRMVMSFYALPTVLSAYLYGRRHATLTAAASVMLVVLLMLQTEAPPAEAAAALVYGRWIDLTVWGGSLIVTGYLMGTLYEHKAAQIQELRHTYDGVLMILRHFISKDEYTEHHSYRVSVYATRLAAALQLSPQRIEDVRAAALLHDIGKLQISRQLLYKAARLTEDEYRAVKEHVARGVEILQPVGGSLRRIIPIILAHHDKFNGSGYHATCGEDIPLEARIIAVADVFDSLTSDRPYRKGMLPADAREIVGKGCGTDFDPQVVAAFEAGFRRGEFDIRSLPASAA